MEQSILMSTRKILQIGLDDNTFDLDVVTHINTALATLNQLGVGPSEGFMIEDDTATWGDFLGDNPKLNSVKTYVYLRVRLLFDPPTTSYAITAINDQLKEMEWRLNAVVDTVPAGMTVLDEELVWELDSSGVFPPEAQVGDVGFDPVTGNVWRKT